MSMLQARALIKSGLQHECLKGIAPALSLMPGEQCMIHQILHPTKKCVLCQLCLLSSFISRLHAKINIANAQSRVTWPLEGREGMVSELWLKRERLRKSCILPKKCVWGWIRQSYLSDPVHVQVDHAPVYFPKAICQFVPPAESRGQRDTEQTCMAAGQTSLPVWASQSVAMTASRN